MSISSDFLLRFLTFRIFLNVLLHVWCRGDERLIGELFVLDTGRRTLQRPVSVQLPHHGINRDAQNIGVLWRPNGSTFCQSAECSPVRLPHSFYHHSRNAS